MLLNDLSSSFDELFEFMKFQYWRQIVHVISAATIFCLATASDTLQPL